MNNSMLPSVTRWDSINDITTKDKKKFSITSMYLEHGKASPWYIKHQFEKYTSGWNRTVSKGFLNHPVACNIRMFGVALESVLERYKYGGTGYITLSFNGQKGLSGGNLSS